MNEIHPGASSEQDVRPSGSGIAPLLVCIGLFAGLGGFVHYATNSRQGHPGLYISGGNLPQAVGEWTLRGPERGWMSEGYPVGSVVHRYERPAGSAMLITGGVSQEHDKTFANVDTTHQQRGHSEVDRIAVTVGPGPGGERTSGEVVVYSPTQSEPGFAYFTVYYDGKQLTTSAAKQKIGVNIGQVIRRPEPWEIMHFMRPMQPDEDRAAAANEVAQFATGLLGSMEGLWQQYVGSVSGH